MPSYPIHNVDIHQELLIAQNQTGEVEVTSIKDVTEDIPKDVIPRSKSSNIDATKRLTNERPF